MGWFSTYNDSKAIAHGPRSIGRRAVYRGAMVMYAAGGKRRRQEELTPKEQVAFVLLVLLSVASAVALVAWLL